MLKEMEQEVISIRQIFKFIQDRQKSYANQQRMLIEFQVGYHVYIFLKPRKSSLKVGYSAKLAPKVCGPFHILKKVGPMVYRLAFPPTVKSHNVFQISLLKK